ncbi:alpha/beta hydrolase [Paenibacillus eucommiae]|uniref:Alpha-beta hydrolase superfamily lysophospholipase n=1 Tax=Paenibacillus eucommiae TaxID=1355755 RepID=A0ABS4IXN8_9BACL|nr:alpha/beta fold hydrolase [Paenibacillus eucommiae]MBP1992344.1 alpha-beta hydrolase superfamily lysophospholipase [Paenibacillus eucommiae]
MSSTSLSPHPLNPAPLEQTAVRVLGRRKKLLITITSSVVLFCTSLLLAFHAYIAWTLARPHIDPLHSNPTLAVGLPFEDITFPSRNETSHLNGWFIPGNSNKTVIFSHGYGGNREELWVPIYKLAQELHKQSYNVLMFDYGYVQPGNQRIVTGGVQESKELLGALDFIKKKIEGPVYIWGFSMGAGTALQAALQDSTEIAGMILDSTFLLNPDTLYHNMKQHVNVPKSPSLQLVRLFFPILNGVSLTEIPYQKVTDSDYNLPIYFIHGTDDFKAPYEMTENIYSKQILNPRTKLWILPAAQHELIYHAEPQLYIESTMKFLDDLSHPFTYGPLMAEQTF